MRPGDYEERQGKNKSGKTVTKKIVTSTTGVEYAIGKKFNSGGVAKVYRATRLRDKKECVFKEYEPSPETRKVHKNIKNNIKKLMESPLMDDDGKTRLNSFIGPMDKDSLIELRASGGFAYIMELVDTDTFLSVLALWHRETYPSADILCRACYNIAHLFERVHKRGWSYKDVNEGNVYINNKTGEVRIMDCDNISVERNTTIMGTDGFMAPEVYANVKPDVYTDYFSMAVLFYRILVGGYPLDGKRTMNYLKANNLTIVDAASTVYGKMALFAFDPVDHSNDLTGLTDPMHPDLYRNQMMTWGLLPPEIQEGFIRTFSTGLAYTNRHLRETDRNWMMIFEHLRTEGLVKCRCGKMNFGDSKKGKKCKFCNAVLPCLKPQKRKPGPTPGPKPGPTPGPKPGPTPPPPPGPKPIPKTPASTVTFDVRRDIAPTRWNITLNREQQVKGGMFYPGLNDGWMKIEYSQTKNLLSVVNKSRFTWLVQEQGVSKDCPPGGRVILKPNIVIAVLRRRLQLTVVAVNIEP